MKVLNVSDGKIIGIGKVTVLPGKEEVIPAEYENSPVLNVYVNAGLIKILDAPKEKTAEEIAKEKELAKKLAEEEAAKAKAEAEALRKARLEAVNAGMSDEELGKLANELGITPADCKDQADVLKKVKAALKK